MRKFNYLAELSPSLRLTFQVCGDQHRAAVRRQDHQPEGGRPAGGPPAGNLPGSPRGGQVGGGPPGRVSHLRRDGDVERRGALQENQEEEEVHRVRGCPHRVPAGVGGQLHAHARGRPQGHQAGEPPVRPGDRGRDRLPDQGGGLRVRPTEA